MRAYWCEYAELGNGPVAGVRIVEDDGRIVTVERGAPVTGDVRLAGLVLPGLANAHSHAFHRALRGRTHDGGGTFWTWRQRMYAVAGRLDPDGYLALARAAYAEMALAGITCVGEFHYVHHPPGGGRYTDPNAMAAALVEAAADAGVRLTLLDTCYLAGGLEGSGHLPLDDVQARFSDGDADAWAARVAMLQEPPGVRVGAAVHSVRAVPAPALARGRPPCTPRTSPTRTPRPTVRPGPATARAPPPRPTSPTASAPSAGCGMPAHRCAWAATSTW
jgi:formiminoglutamate deiminase